MEVGGKDKNTYRTVPPISIVEIVVVVVVCDLSRDYS